MTSNSLLFLGWGPHRNFNTAYDQYRDQNTVIDTYSIATGKRLSLVTVPSPGTLTELGVPGPGAFTELGLPRSFTLDSAENMYFLLELSFAQPSAASLLPKENPTHLRPSASYPPIPIDQVRRPFYEKPFTLVLGSLPQGPKPVTPSNSSAQAQ